MSQQRSLTVKMSEGYLKKHYGRLNWRRKMEYVGAPDLAVEVVSPGQSNNIVFTKVTEYLNAGTEEVWLVYPHRQTVTQIRRDSDDWMVYTVEQAIETPLFPDFTVPIAVLFQIETP